MKPLHAIAGCLAVISVAGCRSGVVTEADQQRVNKDFSRDSYEQAMHKLGKDKELAEEKAKEDAYRSSGGGSSANQDAGQH